MEILLITTKGCEACKIQKNLIKQAIDELKLSINFNTIDIEDCENPWIRVRNFDDFPTTMLIENNNVKYQFVGTKPVNVIIRLIKDHLRVDK